MSRTTRALLCLALALPMSVGASATLAQGPSPDPVLDQTLTLTEMAGTAVAPDAGITVTFASDTTLTGFGGCNNYNATWSTDFATLTVTTDIASTRKVCGPAVDALETQYLGLLQLATSWSLDGTVLEIVSADGSTLVYGGTSAGPSTPTPGATPAASAAGSPAATADIVGAWNLTEMMGTALPAGILKVTIQFAADGTLTGSGGCNDYNARWSLSGTSLTMTGLVTGTGASCDATTQSIEESYFGVLPYLDTAQITDGNLVLGSSFSTSITFTFAPAS